MARNRARGQAVVIEGYRVEETTPPEGGWPVSSRRYQILGQVGQGCWGTVLGAKDRETGEFFALKRLTPTEVAKQQMRERGLSDQDVLKREGGRLVAASNVVPRTIEYDDERRPFLKMPLYKRTLADAIGEDYDQRFRAGHGFQLSRATNFLRGIANGLHEMHTRYGQANVDLSPENVVLDDADNPLIADIGAATCTTMGASDSPRDNMGFFHTRAYEGFREGSHPGRRSNAYSFGALAYRLFAGEYPHEPETRNAIDPAEHMRNLDPKVADAIVKGRVNQHVPKPLRKVIRRCLAYDPDKRPADLESLKKELDTSIGNLSRGRRMLNRAGLWAKILLPTALFGGAIYSSATFEPKKIDMPRVNWGATPLNAPEINGEPIFVGERLEGLPRTTEIMEDDSIVRHASNYKQVAGLFKAYIATIGQMQREGFDLRDFTDAQYEMFVANTSGDERTMAMNSSRYAPVGKSIEVAMYHAQTPNRTIDLEDALSISRLGIDTVNQARYAANSRNFADYVTARRDNGEFVIPAEEQRFLKTWLSYVQSAQGENSND